MKILYGRELADFIKERQAKQVRALRQAHGIFPKLTIVRTLETPVIDTYVRLKRQYGEEVLIEVEDYTVEMDVLENTIAKLNADASIHGVIVQLPLSDPLRTDEILRLVASEKDVDGLGESPMFDAATPTAINWLLAGYGIDIHAHSVAVIGQGRLVGAPLTKMWEASGITVQTYDESTPLDDLSTHSLIVTATGQPHIITSDMIKVEAVVIDAGTATDNGKIVGDVAPEVRMRDDITISAEKGGVGPLTVAALFDNVITAANRRIIR